MSQSINMSQNQRQVQTQVLAPQMRQALRMLELTALDLRTELQQQMWNNPVIEDVKSPIERNLSSELPEEHVSDEISSQELDFTPSGTAAERTLSADDADRDYYLQNLENFTVTSDSGSIDPDVQSRRQAMFDRQVKSETLQEHLQNQITLSDIPEEDLMLAEILVEYIDDDGYFRGSIPDIVMVSGATEAQILNTLSRISKLDPVGCGGRDLRECLLFQMDKLDDSPWEDEVRMLIDRHLEDIASHREALICSQLRIEPSDYPKVLSELRKLNPKPGSGFSKSADVSIYVRPEIFLSKTDSGEWKVRVTDRDIPDIHISKKYIAMLEDPNCSVEAKKFIREKIRAAEQLIEAIEERQETIKKIAQAIVDRQTDVFENKSLASLKPLTMEQIAQKTEVHNATVSRTVRGKYMSTPLGVIELRKFFTAGLTTNSGETVSNMAVKERIRQIIDEEDRKQPLSDDAISKQLKSLGIKCERRTVAKYRESLGIPGATKRRIK